ncbi:hypothetical protein QQP08_018145 [Theobroma cacao]|nr:hypothetical protein QQP08_018145 [Theobroma cacao]
MERIFPEGGIIEGRRGMPRRIVGPRLRGPGRGDCSPRFAAQGDESDVDSTFCCAQKRLSDVSDKLFHQDPKHSYTGNCWAKTGNKSRKGYLWNHKADLTCQTCCKIEGDPPLIFFTMNPTAPCSPRR